MIHQTTSWSIFFLLSIALAASASAQTVVVPASFENTEAPGSNNIPFGTDLFCDNGIRYQQVYTGGQLPNGSLITALRFRLDENEADPYPPTVYAGTSVSVSTAVNGPGSLSNTLAENIGSDVVEVFSGDLTLSATTSTEVPRPFDVEIAFQTPFLYAGGDLLVDIVVENCPASPGIFFDRASDTSATERMTARDITDTVADAGSGAGLVTQFQVASVEPRPIPLFGGMATGPVLLIVLMLVAAFLASRRATG